MANDNPFPTRDGANPDQSINRVYDWAVARVRQWSDWYDRNKQPKKKGSQYLRAVSILLAALGAICPLLQAIPAVGDRVTLGQVGYVLIAGAAALVGYDRYFGLSTGWMRYMVTRLSLERALREFQYDWVMLLARYQSQKPPVKDGLLLLQRVKDFSLQAEGLVRQETDAWVLEFQSNIAGLEKMLKSEAEVRRPGSVKVSVPNAREFDRVKIFLNDGEVKTLAGVTEALIDSVPPGRYEVAAQGSKGGRDVRASKVVEVPANGMTAAEITLPDADNGTA